MREEPVKVSVSYFCHCPEYPVIRGGTRAEDLNEASLDGHGPNWPPRGVHRQNSSRYKNGDVYSTECRWISTTRSSIAVL